MNPRRPDSSEHAPYYSRYIDLVPETDLPQALLDQLEQTAACLGSLPEALHDHRYAEGKWTIREVMGHILDTERILGMRLLRFARGDASPMSRADENLYVRNAEFGRYTMGELLEEYRLVRRSHAMLLSHLPEAAWDRTGPAADHTVSVRALAYMLVGHERHHLNIVRTRYLGQAE
jgi:hypothetical protein